MKLPNRNQIILAIGLAVTQGPQVKAVADWLGSFGIPHLAKLVVFLGWVSTALGSAAQAWPRIRPWLAGKGLATPPGALAPWIPGKDGTPVVQAPRAPDPDSVNTPVEPYTVLPDTKSPPRNPTG